MRVDIDLGISAQLNIKKYFEIRKKSHAKEVKTKDAASVAIKSDSVVRTIEKALHNARANHTTIHS